MHPSFRTLLSMTFVSASFGQTMVDLRTQGKNVDFSVANSTRPFKSGPTVPPVCAVGEMFYKTDAPAGMNLYGCVSPNAWVPEASGSSILAANRTSPDVLTIGQGCSIAFPCNIRFGNLVFSIVSNATATVKGGSGVAFIYVSSSGALTIGSTLTLTCSANCSLQDGVTSFPADSVPLYTWSATNGEWDLGGGADLRAFISAKPLQSGLGLTSTEIGGKTVFEIDTALISLRTPVPASSNSACVPGSWAMDSSFLYLCAGPSAWRRVALAAW